MISHEYATADEIDRHLTNVEAGLLDLATSPLVSAWGERVDSPDPGSPSAGR